MKEKIFHRYYSSPIGQLSLMADEQDLLGAWFIGQKYENRGYENALYLAETNPILDAAVGWLDVYFAGEESSVFPYLNPKGTDFQKKVWEQLKTIPLGQTSSYGQLAMELKCRSAQAVGGAVGKNPLSIFIPCHRVLGTDGSLTGYAGGLERKSWLLKHERRRH